MKNARKQTQYSLSCRNITEKYTTFFRITKQSFTAYRKYSLADETIFNY